MTQKSDKKGNKHFGIYLYLIFLYMVPFSVNAEGYCITYAGEGKLSASMQLAHDQARENASKTIISFVEYAKKNNTKQITNRFSRIDGSYDYVEKMLKEMPDKYSSFSGIKSLKLEEAFEWGKYIVAWVDYLHKRGRAKLLESVLCTNPCQMSNIFERPAESENLVSRYMSLIRTAAKHMKSCPGGANTFAVYPTFIKPDGPPLKFYFTPKFNGKKYKKLFSTKALGVKGNNIRSCASLIERSRRVIDQSMSDLQILVNKFVSQCAIKMTQNSLVPIADITGNVKRIFMTPVALIGTLQKVKEVNLLYAFNDSGIRVGIYLLSLPDGSKKIIVIPLKQHNGNLFIDWSYYGTASGELLSSAAFANFVKENNASYFE